MTPLEAAALGAMAWATAGFAVAVAAAWRRGVPGVTAASAGSPWPGIIYAFGAGMSPRAKESASQHPWLYAAGILYHAGIAAAGSTLVITLAGGRVPSVPARALALLLLAAGLAGAGLIWRRVSSPLLRAISAPDDYASNLLVDGWLATAAIALLRPEATPGFLVVTIALALYAPLGKIRHCIFFLIARGQYGARLGRRGIVGPPRPGGHP